MIHACALQALIVTGANNEGRPSRGFGETLDDRPIHATAG